MVLRNIIFVVQEVLQVMMDTRKLLVTVSPFESVASVIDRIVQDLQLVEKKDYKMAEHRNGESAFALSLMQLARGSSLTDPSLAKSSYIGILGVLVRSISSMGKRF